MYNFISTFDELNKLYEEVETKKVEEACTEELTEAADEDILEDEVAEGEIPEEDIPAEEPVVEEEPRRVICECDKCGALVIKDEADIVADEETDLVNVEDECQFCEEAKGFKIVGIVAPYETIAEELPEEETADEEPIEEDEVVEESVEVAVEDDMIVEEGLDDLYRKVFDRPASVSVQQDWEAELNGENGEISDKRRKHLEKKFQQQRDWEARHPDKEVK